LDYVISGQATSWPGLRVSIAEEGDDLLHLHMHNKKQTLECDLVQQQGVCHRFIQAAKRYAPLFLPERRWIVG